MLHARRGWTLASAPGETCCFGGSPAGHMKVHIPAITVGNIAPSLAFLNGRRWPSRQRRRRGPRMSRSSRAGPSPNATGHCRLAFLGIGCCSRAASCPVSCQRCAAAAVRGGKPRGTRGVEDFIVCKRNASSHHFALSLVRLAVSFWGWAVVPAKPQGGGPES